VRVERVTDPGPGLPAVRIVDAGGDIVTSVEQFLALLTVRGHSPNTIRAYAHDLQKLYLFLAERGLAAADFRPATAIAFVRWLRSRPVGRPAQRLTLGVADSAGRHLSPRTCNRILAAVSSFYEFLIMTEGFTGSENPILRVGDTASVRVLDRHRPPLVTSKSQRPVRRAIRVKTIDTLPRPLAIDVYLRLLAATTNLRDKAILELMFEGGLRPGEVLGLHLDDIAYGRRRVVVRHRDDHPRGARQKSRRERVVDLWEDRALPAISRYVSTERPADAESRFVFLVGRGPRRGQPLSYDGLVRMFRRAAERASVRSPWMTPHTLRHTHATRMFEGGMRELTLMKRLGHASPESLQIYTRVSDPEVLKDYRMAMEGR